MNYSSIRKFVTASQHSILPHISLKTILVWKINDYQVNWRFKYVVFFKSDSFPNKCLGVCATTEILMSIQLFHIHH